MAFNGVVTADRLIAPPHGLFSVARVQNRGARDEHWIGGFFVETEACSTTTEGLPLCNATDTDSYTIHDGSSGSPFFHVVAFGIVEKFECENSVGYNAIDRRATAVDQLERVTEYAVEQELWSGTAAQRDDSPIAADRWLTAATDVTPTAGTAVSPEVALALVEQEFASANPGIQATIHVTPLIASVIEKSLDVDTDGKLHTINGSLVAISRGGNGEAGPAAGGSNTKHWIYATGPVHVDLGSEELITTSASESVNPLTNAVIFAAERPAAVYFDGCAWFGALADATL